MIRALFGIIPAALQLIMQAVAMILPVALRGGGSALTFAKQRPKAATAAAATLAAAWILRTARSPLTPIILAAAVAGAAWAWTRWRGPEWRQELLRTFPWLDRLPGWDAIHVSPETGDAAEWADRPSHLYPLLLPDGTREAEGRITLGRAILRDVGDARRHRPYVASLPGQHVLVVGATQSGKTSGLLLPTLLGNWPGPVVATSVKTDLLANTVKWRANLGPVTAFDPTGQAASIVGPSDLWSPLDAARTWVGALRVANQLVHTASHASGDNRIWQDLAEMALAPMMHAAALEGHNIERVLDWLAVPKRHPEVTTILDSHGATAARRGWTAVQGYDERQRSSIYMSIDQVMRGYQDPGVLATAVRTGTRFSPESWLAASGPRTHYIAAPLRDQNRLAPVLSAHVGEVLAAADTVAQHHGGRLPEPLLVLLDETANIAPLHALPETLSTASSAGITIVTVFQDIAQLHATYPEAGGTIVNNSAVKVIMSGTSDPATLDLVTRLTGNAELDDDQARRDALTPVQVLRQGRTGTGVLIASNVPPVRLHLGPWYEDATLTHRAEHGTDPRDDTSHDADDTPAGAAH